MLRLVLRREALGQARLRMGDPVADEVMLRCAIDGDGRIDIARLLRDEALAAERARAVAHAARFCFTERYHQLSG